MKKILLLALAIYFCFTTLRAQDNTKIYEIRNNIPVWVSNILGQPFCDAAGKNCNDSFYIPPFRSRFAYVRNKGSDTVLIRMLRFDYYNNSSRSSGTSDSLHDALQAKAKRLSSIFSYNVNHQLRYFKMLRSDFDSGCVKYYNTGFSSSAFTIGVITMPLKLRLGSNFDFQGNFSLGTTAGIKMRLSHYSPNYFNFLFGASISSVTLDSFSTNGKVPGQPLNNIAAFSPSFGAVFEFGSAQAGIFYGWDLIGKSTQSKYSWIYNGKPWISIGFGFSILTITSKSSQSSTAQTNTVTKDTPDVDAGESTK